MINSYTNLYIDEYVIMLDELWNKNIFDTKEWTEIVSENHRKMIERNNNHTNYTLNYIVIHDFMKFLALEMLTGSNNPFTHSGKNNDVLYRDIVLWTVSDTTDIIPNEGESLNSLKLIEDATKIMHDRVEACNEMHKEEDEKIAEERRRVAKEKAKETISVYSQYETTPEDIVLSILSNGEDQPDGVKEVFTLARDFVRSYKTTIGYY